MIADNINDTGFIEPMRFEWRVTGYFTPDLLEDHIDRLARAAQKWLKTCHWPAKEFQYGAATVEPMALCPREERKKASLDKNGRAYLAMTLQITVQLKRGRIFVPRDVSDLRETLISCLFPMSGEPIATFKGSGFRSSLPIGGFEGGNAISSTLRLCPTDELAKVLGRRIYGGIVFHHAQTQERFPAYPILAFIDRNLLEFKGGPTKSDEQRSKVPDHPVAMQAVLQELLDTYLASYHIFKKTIAAAHKEGTSRKTIKNVVTNAEIVVSSLTRLVNTIKQHVGKSAPKSTSQFCVKRWIKNFFRTESHTICLDSTSFDVDLCKRTLLTRLRPYKRTMLSIIGAARLLDPSTREEFKKVINSTANTPDKAELLRLYERIWHGLPNFTREQVLASMDSFMRMIEDEHYRLAEQLDLLNMELGRAFGPAIPTDMGWDDLKEKALDSHFPCYI
ncbi:hypothetical protein QBC45DRAFT_363624 [Copromyces sp. CBS 386.78]|nr:hypothetical protein QBC45DRAFT_363624 [Copromyces sp. CBS 386.78]